jgi:thioester reductase-like protein
MASGVRAAHDQSVCARMQRDARLGALNTSAIQARIDRDAQVLLTGATGFFGPFLLHSLLELTPFSYHILIRARDRAAGLERVRASMHQARLWTPAIDRELASRVTIVTGDLAAPGLGLDAATWKSLASRVDMVIHNGAAVNYVASYDALRRTNVEGTRDLLRFACDRQVKEFHYISSTVIFGWTSAPEVRETERNAGMANLDFGYAQSKWVAEQLVLDARSAGARTYVYRPSFISASTAGIVSNDDIVVRLLAFMINKRMAVNALNQVSFLPADVVAHNIASIIRDPRRQARAVEPVGTVHVTADEYYNLMDVTRIMTRAYGYEFEYFDIPDFVAELRRRCGPDDAMYPLLDFFTRSRDKMAAMQHKRYSNIHYRLARDHAGAARPEPSLEATVDYLHAAMLSAGAIAR